MFSTKINRTTNAVTVGEAYQDGEAGPLLIRVWLIQEGKPAGRMTETRAENVPQGITNITEKQWLAGNIPNSPYYCSVPVASTNPRLADAELQNLVTVDSQECPYTPGQIFTLLHGEGGYYVQENDKPVLGPFTVDELRGGRFEVVALAHEAGLTGNNRAIKVRYELRDTQSGAVLADGCRHSCASAAKKMKGRKLEIVEAIGHYKVRLDTGKGFTLSAPFESHSEVVACFNQEIALGSVSIYHFMPSSTRGVFIRSKHNSR